MKILADTLGWVVEESIEMQREESGYSPGKREV
jgi:hypothetical protein